MLRCGLTPVLTLQRVGRLDVGANAPPLEPRDPSPRIWGDRWQVHDSRRPLGAAVGSELELLPGRRPRLQSKLEVVLLRACVGAPSAPLGASELVQAYGCRPAASIDPQRHWIAVSQRPGHDLREDLSLHSSDQRRTGALSRPPPGGAGCGSTDPPRIGRSREACGLAVSGARAIDPILGCVERSPPLRVFDPPDDLLVSSQAGRGSRDSDSDSRLLVKAGHAAQALAIPPRRVAVPRQAELGSRVPEVSRQLHALRPNVPESELLVEEGDLVLQRL